VAEAFNERNRKELGLRDVRYTQKGKLLYAFAMGWGEPEAVFPELGTGSEFRPGKIGQVTLLGHRGVVKWTQDAGGLKVQLPGRKPSEHAVALRVEGV
jgi:alpha-L-fucosidase